MNNIPGESKEFSVYQNPEGNLEGTEEHIVGNNVGKEGVNDDSEDTNPKKNLKRTAMRIGAAVGGGLLLGSLPGSTVDANSVKLAEQNNSEENKPSITEQYHVEIPDKSESSPEFVIDKTGGSGLDGDGFPIEKEVVMEADSENSIESFGDFLEVVPSFEELKEYEVVKSEKLDSYEETKVVSNFFKIYSFPLREDMFPGDTFRVSTVKLDEYINQDTKRLDPTTGSQKLEGLGFSVHNIITLRGPKGDKVKLGEYHNLFGWYTKTYLLMEYKDMENQTYSFTSKEFSEEEKASYGKRDNSFLNTAHELYDDVIRDDNNAIETEKYKLDRELNTSLVQEIYDIQDLRELKDIAKEDKSIKVILGITQAINTYPGDEVVTDEYLEQMYEYNLESYGLEAIGLENGSIEPEKMTKYLLNYVNKDGNSWYRDFLDFQKDIQTWYKEHLELKRNPWGYNTFYNNQTKLVRDLNLLSPGVKVKGKNVQPFGVANLYTNLIGLPAPLVMSAPVENVRDLIPSEISQYDGGFFFSGMIKDTYTSPHFENYGDVMVGDMLVSQEKNHLKTIFYESEAQEGSTKWAFDVDEEGMIRLYKWNNDGKRLYPIGPLSSPYGRYDLLRHVKNLPFERQQQHWAVKYSY